MTTKEIFLQLLKDGKYKNAAFWAETDFDEQLHIAENDRSAVFHAAYGDKMIRDHGTKPIKEYLYRLVEAENDQKHNYIKMVMHYLIMQIHNGDLTLQKSVDKKT